MKKVETRWVFRETDADLQLMANVLHINEITATVMANRGIRSRNAAVSFLSPSVKNLRDVKQMKDMTKAIERVSSAVSNEKIMIYGDYDADGITSTVILYKTLKRLGADCEYYIPHRVDEGYGLNNAAVEKLAERGVKLIITADNGIAAIEEVKTAAALGIDIVIIDHHEPQEVLPEAAAIVDPKQPDCGYPFKEMCAAGLVFRFGAALCEYMDNPFTAGEYDEVLALAAIGTLCDIVPLEDENRIIVTGGLTVLNTNKLINPGLGSLITIRGYLHKAVTEHTVGFVLGPCLNATGRLESAELAVELLLSDIGETEKRLKLAYDLTEINDARKNITAECVERSLSAAMENPSKILVLTDFEAHESVAGIVAGRIRDNVGRPAILLTKGDGAIKGSGRSIESYNLFEALYKNRHLFHRFGGHAMAAGLTLPEENIEALRAALNDECTLTEDDFKTIMNIDRVISLDEINLALSDELASLAPFGKGNKEPLFVTYGLHASTVRIIEEKSTIIFSFIHNSGRWLKGVAYNLNDVYAAEFGNQTAEVTFNAAYHIETNFWNNKAEVQIKIKDIKK